MKILHLITDLDVGGAEVMLFNLACEHHKKGIEMCVVGLTGDGLIGERIKQLGITVKSLGMRPGILDIQALTSLDKIVRDFKPDIIQSWMYHSDLIGSLLAIKRRNIPVLWGLHHTINETGSMKTATIFIVKLNAFLSRWLPSKIICCSNATYKTHMDLGFISDKMIVIQNGIDIEKFQIDDSARHSVRSDLGLGKSIPLIGMLARFHPQKDHRTFILAAEILISMIPDVHFILAGKDIETGNSKLVSWIKSAGLEKHFHLLGLRADSSRLYAALDIGTLSSANGEGLPISICEAMACGLPCVVTDIGDSSEVIGETGITVQPGNPIELANGWKKILSLNAEEYAKMRIQARSRIERLYNIIETADRYHNIYLSIHNCDD
jgi:glycosyltransferase involved in cell wall biosynthesis